MMGKISKYFYLHFGALPLCPMNANIRKTSDVFFSKLMDISEKSYVLLQLYMRVIEKNFCVHHKLKVVGEIRSTERSDRLQMKNKAAYDSSLHGRGGYQTGLNIVWEQPDRKWFSNADRSLIYICKYSMSANYIQSANQLVQA